MQQIHYNNLCVFSEVSRSRPVGMDAVLSHFICEISSRWSDMWSAIKTKGRWKLSKVRCCSLRVTTFDFFLQQCHWGFFFLIFEYNKNEEWSKCTPGTLAKYLVIKIIWSKSWLQVDRNCLISFVLIMTKAESPSICYYFLISDAHLNS